MQYLEKTLNPRNNILTREQVKEHNKSNDAWIIIDKIVYDVSEYWRIHPGGGLGIL